MILDSQPTNPDPTWAHAILRERRSIRHFRDGVPSRYVLSKILMSAGAAPSAHNRQPWRFAVIEDCQIKRTLALAMGARLSADRRRDGDDEGNIRQDVDRTIARIVGAPILVLVAMTMSEMDPYPDNLRSRCEYLMAVQSAAMAGQNLLLAAYAEGLGACWMCAPLFCPSEVSSVLELPQDWQPQGLVAIGYPRASANAKPRKTLDEFVLSFFRGNRAGGLQ